MYLSLSVATIDRLVAAGRLRAVKLGSGRSASVRIQRASLLKLVGELPESGCEHGKQRAAQTEFTAAAAAVGLSNEGRD
jgi:excisionase family DNA binding protein